MVIEDLDKFRNGGGYIVLDNIPNPKIVLEKRGTRPKKWFVFENGKVLFKEALASSYIDYAQLFFEEFAKQSGLEVAHYDLAIYQGKKGVVSPDFLKENERLISFELFLKMGAMVAKETNANIKFNNTIEDIIKALSIQGFEDETLEKVLALLIQICLLDGLILETDRNSTNLSLLVKKNKVEMSPFYDGSNSFGLNRSVSDIQSKVKNIRDVGTIHSIIMSAKRGLPLNNLTSDMTYMEEVEKLLALFPEITSAFIPVLLNINFDEALKNIEEKIGAEVPFECSIWVDKILKYNKENLKYVYDESFKKQK